MRQREIWLVNFGPPLGPEQAGHRPAIILQDDALTQTLFTATAVPLTTNMKRLSLPATLLLKAGEGGLTRDSVVLGFQVQVRGKDRLLNKIGELSAEAFADVQDAVLIALGL